MTITEVFTESTSENPLPPMEVTFEYEPEEPDTNYYVQPDPETVVITEIKCRDFRIDPDDLSPAFSGELLSWALELGRKRYKESRYE